MKLKCGKCQKEFEVPPEVLRSAEPRAECPFCRTRYRLKPRTGLLPNDVAAGADVRLRTTPSMPLPGSTSSAAAGHAGGATARPPAENRPTTPLPTPPSSIADSEGATVVSTGGLSSGRLRLGGPVFAAGDLVSQRYRIVRFLAQGGMGEVYEAEDIELRQEVALKTVSAHIGGDPAAIDRFKREIALARRVTHPNVCRIFDLGQHQMPEWTGGQGGNGTVFGGSLTFLTMELLRGETLAQMLRRQGRLSTEEALPLIEQMAAALDAAHRAQIVHRDFKSENVFLVDGETPGEKRAVVTDFGVARGSDHSDRFAAQVTGLGIVGTPAYMAPEQVENKEVTAAADLYALGIVIYEMVTGRLPFESPNPLTTAVKRLKEAPPPPHVLVPDLPAYWEKAILRCLEREPQDRFASASELVEALRKPTRGPRPNEVRTDELHRGELRGTAVKPAAAQPAVLLPPRPAKTPLSRTTQLFIVLLCVAVISAALATFNYFRGGKAKSGVKLRRAVAVLDLKNLSQKEESAWISTALAEMLSTETARGASLRAISRQEIAEARQDLQVVDLALPSRSELEKLRARLGCDYVLAGTYFSLTGEKSDQLRIDLGLQDAGSGKQVATFSEQGALADLVAIVGRLGESLRQNLGSNAAVADSESGLPRNSEASKLYAEALDALRSGQALEASELLARAKDIEGDNPLIRSALASAFSALGFKDKAKAEASQAFELSSRLAREEKLWIEGRLRELEGNAAAARDLYRTLFEAYPDDLDYGLALVAAERSSGSARAALDTIDALRRLPPPLGDDLRIDLAEADAAAQIGLVERQLIAAERAVGKAQQQDARLQLARALLQKSQSQRVLGQSEGAVDAARKALGLFEKLGYKVGRAQAANALGTCLLAAGKVDEAAGACEQAAALYREAGDLGGLAASLNNLAMVEKRQGDLPRVEELYEETEQIFRQTGDRRGLALAVNNQAVLLVERDRLAEAHAMFESSRPVWEEIAGALGGALSLHNLAQVVRLEGDLDQAQKLHEQALDARRKAGIKPDLTSSLANLAGLLLDAGQVKSAATLLDEARKLADEVGDPSLLATVLAQQGELALLEDRLPEARQFLEQTLEIRRQGQEALLLTGAQVSLARLALAQEESVGAIQLAQQALEATRRDGRPAEETRAAAVLAAALLFDDDLENAGRVLAERKALAATTQQPFVRLSFDLAEARLLAAREGKTALPRLKELAAEARKRHYLPLALEIELAWANAAARAGLATEAAQQRKSVAEEAQGNGLLHLEKLAHQAAS